MAFKENMFGTMKTVGELTFPGLVFHFSQMTFTPSQEARELPKKYLIQTPPQQSAELHVLSSKTGTPCPARFRGAAVLNM
jgi:hypothetical protein